MLQFWPPYFLDGEERQTVSHEDLSEDKTEFKNQNCKSSTELHMGTEKSARAELRESQKWNGRSVIGQNEMACIMYHPHMLDKPFTLMNSTFLLPELFLKGCSGGQRAVAPFSL